MLTLLFACATVQLPEPNEAMAAATPGITVEELTKGRDLLRVRCGNCHTPPHPRQARTPAWSATFTDMTRRARLTPEEARRIEAYMLAGSAMP